MKRRDLDSVLIFIILCKWIITRSKQETVGNRFADLFLLLIISRVKSSLRWDYEKCTKKKKNTYNPDSEVNSISKGETRQREHELICQSWPETWLRTGSDILYHTFLPDLRHADYLSLSTSNAHGDRCPESSPNDPHIGKNVENMERKKESPALEGLITTSLCVRVGWKCEVVILVSCHTADNRLFHKS